MTLHKGLTNRSAKAVDKSMTPTKGSVNNGATRKGAAAHPKTLGPRTA